MLAPKFDCSRSGSVDSNSVTNRPVLKWNYQIIRFPPAIGHLLKQLGDEAHPTRTGRWLQVFRGICNDVAERASSCKITPTLWSVACARRCPTTALPAGTWTVHPGMWPANRSDTQSLLLRRRTDIFPWNGHGRLQRRRERDTPACRGVVSYSLDMAVVHLELRLCPASDLVYLESFGFFSR